MSNWPRLYGSLLITALTLACGMQAAVITPTPPPTATISPVYPIATAQRWCIIVLVDTLTLRHEPSESSPAYDGLELHKGDKVYPLRATWDGSNIWYQLSPVEWIAGMIDGKPMMGAC